MENARSSASTPRIADHERGVVPPFDLDQGQHGTRSSPRALGVLHGGLRPDLRPLALVPPQDQRTGDVDTGVGAGDDTDEKVNAKSLITPRET